VFDGYSAEAFQEAGFRALRTYADAAKWQAMLRRGMARDFSWERSVDQYLEVYRRAVAHAAMR
jgi:starch synthase